MDEEPPAVPAVTYLPPAAVISSGALAPSEPLTVGLVIGRTIVLLGVSVAEILSRIRDYSSIMPSFTPAYLPRRP